MANPQHCGIRCGISLRVFDATFKNTRLRNGSAGEREQEKQP
jgi:hypothetical protein